jgi:Cu(I)/Ag(I) efflux system periplasmic protein CusF
MKLISTAALLAALAMPALAQPVAEDHAAHHPAAAASAVSAADMTDGEVRKVDKGAKKLTIKHGEIRNLDMPPMTMVFQVKDTSLLDRVKAGDKVRFVVEKADSGYLVTDILMAK